MTQDQDPKKHRRLHWQVPNYIITHSRFEYKSHHNYIITDNTQKLSNVKSGKSI